jgi:mRNA interferase MazF
VRHSVAGFDEVIQEGDLDFAESGLKVPSVIRVGRLAVVEGEIIVGAIGQVAVERLWGIRSRLAEWLTRS